MSIPEGGVYDIVVYQGRTFIEVLESRLEDEVTVVPLTGWVGKAQIRTKPGGGDLLADFTVEVDGLGGTVTISLTAEQTQAMTRGGFWDLKLVNGDTETAFIAPSKVQLIPEVTE